MSEPAENSRFERSIPPPDVVDAMLRQPHDASARPFVRHRLGTAPLTIRAADYDLGPAGVAYADTVDANYHVATGGERVLWNNGVTYSNDGVDIAREADSRPAVVDSGTGGWWSSHGRAATAGHRDTTVSTQARKRRPNAHGEG